ncbi:integrin-linked protein kinase-like [Symsagittifera roscoffensis]|uniref:integrin-linked protein kinase-like n=1 Tax=Symsagittifera roscoffensis TaxID=84072 RepID=UPI00307C7CE9
MTQEAVIQACKDGDLMFLREWLDNIETDPNGAIDQHLFTPLHWASWYGHMALVDLLLTPPHSARTDVVNMGEDTPLHCAAQNGHTHVIRRLLRTTDKSGKKNSSFRPISEVNAMNRHGNTPLHYAAFWGFKETALELVNLGANVSLCNRQNNTPLDVAKGKVTGVLARELREAAENTGQQVTRIPFETAFEEVSTRIRTVRPRDGTMRRFGISSDKISMDEVQNLQSAPMGMVSHPWRELLHGVIPGGTKVVATRVVRPQTADPKRVARDFDAECKKLKVFSHANIHGVFSWINTPDYMFLLSELTPQLGTLYEVLHCRSDVVLEASQMAKVAANIASGMEFLFGIEHTGFHLTSKSVIITDELVAKLNMSETKLSFETPYREYNPEWCSPEYLDASHKPNKSNASASGKGGTGVAINPISLHSAQIWSMGVVLWELLTGQIPFADMNRFHIGFKIVYSRLRLDLPRPESLKEKPLVHLCKLMKMMMNEDPNQRPQFSRIAPLMNKIQ